MAAKSKKPKPEQTSVQDQVQKTTRQPLILIATGKQGGGKTFTTKQEIQQ
jgi:pantothenate kinase-related protein Tda10